MIRKQVENARLKIENFLFDRRIDWIDTLLLKLKIASGAGNRPAMRFEQHLIVRGRGRLPDLNR
jgi:hypothetical protein